MVEQAAAGPQQARAAAARRGRSAPPPRARPSRCWRSRRTARRRPRGSRRRGSRPGRRRRPPARARGASRACCSDSVIPSARTPWRAAAWITKLPQPQPTSSTRSPSLQAELAADQLELGLLRLLERLARRPRSTRSCRSSRGPGTARRSRCRRRSGGGRPGGRARSCAVRRGAAARPPARGGGSTSPQARTSACGEPEPAGASASGGGSNVSTIRSARVEVVDLDHPGHIGAAEPELAGRPQRRGRAPAACGSVNVGRRARWPRTSVPSQKRTPNGRRGRLVVSARRSGAVSRSATAEAQPAAGGALRVDALGVDPHDVPGQAGHLQQPDDRAPTDRSASASGRGGRSVGNAWWLLCQASPHVGIASQARLRDSSRVS